MTFDRPTTLAGDALADELAAAGFPGVTPLDNADGTVTLTGLPDDADPDAVAAVVDAHDPEVLHPDPRRMPADGATPATVRWQRRGSAGTQVAYDVNGTAGSTAADADGVVELSVTAAQPGPVRVQVGTLSVTLTAEEV